MDCTRIMKQPMFVLIVLAAGCGASMKQLETRASYDLSCGDLDYKQLDDRTFGVQGCGKRATYVESCEHSSYFNCTWRAEPAPSTP